VTFLLIFQNITKPTQEFLPEIGILVIEEGKYC